MSKHIGKILLVSCVLLAAAATFIAVKTDAVPSFARQNGTECSTCHTQWPQLNEYGREFKESGYNLTGPTTNVAEGVDLDRTFPASAALNLRFIDKRFSSDSPNQDLNQGEKQLLLRAGHELEAFMAGRASEQISFFAEIEAEDEWPDPAGDAPGFQLQLATAVAEYRCMGGATFTGGFGNVFFADPYNTLYHHRVVRREWNVAGNVPSDAQFISVSGRFDAVPVLFLLAALSGNDGDLEGRDARDYSFRAAYDLKPWLMIGGYANLGRTYNPGTWRSEDQIDRGGIDFQIDKDQFHVNGVWSRQHDYTRDVGQDVIGTWETFAAVELQYIITDQNDQPEWVPYLMLDYYAMDIMDTGGGTGHTMPRDISGYGLFLSHFFKQNARAQIGVEGTLTAAENYYNLEHKETRVTIAGYFGF
jgi:hypothetical protein